MQEAIQSCINQDSETSVESVWNEIKSCLIYAYEKKCLCGGRFGGKKSERMDVEKYI